MARQFASNTNSDARDFAFSAMVNFARPAKMPGMPDRSKNRTHLRKAREDARLTLEAAEAALARMGVQLSAGQLSRLERGQSDVTMDRLEQLGRLYGWTPAQLINGRADDAGARPRVRELPLINRVEAGRWTDVGDPASEMEPLRWVVAPNPVGPRAFALEVSGPSMEPEFSSGDIIIVDPDRTPQPGNGVVALIDHENEATFKRYRVKRIEQGKPVVELVPINPNWPVLELGPGGRILGVVTDHVRRLV